MSGDLKAKLARMRGESSPKQEANRELARQLERRLPRLEDVPQLADADLSTGLPERLDRRSNERGTYYERVTRFPREHRHGDWQLDEIELADAKCFALLTKDPELVELDLASAVYLDTETTGLSGGAGTYVFQVGLGRFDESGFELWQGFMAEPDDEPGLLEETARRIRESAGVVSFFGKSFDRHRLEDKMRLHEVDPPFATRPHLDLYHPLRRLFRGSYEDGRLRTMEYQLTGLERPDDLPGSLAPAAWFDFLHDRAHRLEGVFRHNADDVLSLVTLAAYLGHVEREERRDGSALAGDSCARCAQLAFASFEARREERGRDWVARAQTRLEAETLLHRELRFANALSLKRSKESERAWEELEVFLAEPSDPFSVPAAIEAAKLLEHSLKDKPRALELCEAAFDLCEALHTGAEYARLRRDLEHRIRRLNPDAE